MINAHRLLFAFIFSFVLLSGSYVQAQQEKAAPEKEEVAALREKAYQLLESVAGQLNTLQSSENRTRMGSNLVESLWKHDEQRARSLLRMVQEDIKTELQKIDRLTYVDEENSRFNVFLKLRLDTIDRLAKHDGEAALEFLTATKPTLVNGRESYDFREREQQLEMRLAQQIAVNNPDAALKLARQALKRGYSFDILTLLDKLNRKHKAQGQLLYKDIVEKFREADLDDWNARTMAQTLVQAFVPPAVDELIFRDLISVFVTKALAHGCAQKFSDEEGDKSEFCRWLATTISGAERYDPRASRIKQYVVEGYDTQRFTFTFNEMEELLSERAYDQVEALALKHPELQMSIYLGATHTALNNGDLAQARKFVDLLPADQTERRKDLLAQIDRYENKSAVTEEKLAGLQRALEEMPDVRRRIDVLVVQANLLGEMDRNVALKLLNQASDLVETLSPGKDQTMRRLGLAVMYAMEKSDRGFAIMESLLPKLNELVDISVKLDGYDTSYLRDGEWNMSANGATGEILTRLSQQAGSFAWCDFDRAVSLASQFERPEIRLMAQLKLAQSILAGPPKRLMRYYE
jgi:hypothetical protein